ncbi:MAG: hypothetical protein KDK69_03940 [Chlamydiia bacterium]|nr:hypothetical protein [Chlamydiia bacterium]
MAISTPFTLKNIRDYIPDEAYTLLTKQGSLFDQASTGEMVDPITNSDLADLSSKGQDYYDFNTWNHFNIQVAWHLDQSQKIEGIFIRIYQQNGKDVLQKKDTFRIDAYIIRKTDYESISITNQQTKHLPSSPFNKSAIQSIFSPLRKKKSHDTLPCLVRNLHDKTQIKTFFTGHEKLLPEPLRKQIFP